MVAPYEMNEEPKENAPPKKAAAEGQSPSIEEIMAEIDKISPPEDAEAAPEEMAAEGAEMAMAEEAVEGEAAAMSLAPLTETLGVTEERAQMLYDAAQELAKTQGLEPQELADMIANDFDVLMQLETIAARGEGADMGEPAPEPAPGEAPMGEQMMPPEGM